VLVGCTNGFLSWQVCLQGCCECTLGSEDWCATWSAPSCIWVLVRGCWTLLAAAYAGPDNTLSHFLLPPLQVVRLLKTNYRMLITGTPLQVGVGPAARGPSSGCCRLGLHAAGWPSTLLPAGKGPFGWLARLCKLAMASPGPRSLLTQAYPSNLAINRSANLVSLNRTTCTSCGRCSTSCCRRSSPLVRLALQLPGW